VDKLPSLLWSLWTSINRSTGYTPFFLVYGAEAVIPFDLDFDALRVHFYDEQRAEEQCQVDVDMLKEESNITMVRSIGYQQGLHRYHARRVHERSFVVGDLVLWRATPSKKGHAIST
jgi:hypothetical protein